MEPYIKTRIGQEFWFDAPKTEAITLLDGAHAGANICRFNGHVRDFFSVAQHECECALLTYEWTGDKEAALVSLMHDFHESYVHDVTSPLKMVLGTPYRKVEAAAAAVVQDAFGIGELVIKHREVMRKADLEMLWSDAIRWGTDGTYVENGLEFEGERTWVPKDFKPHFADAYPSMPSTARAEFLRLFKLFDGPNYVRYDSVYRGLNKHAYLSDARQLYV